MGTTSLIVTDRLILRRFILNDIPYCYDNWMSDPDVTEFLTWETHRDISVTACYITSCIREYSRGSMDWCIALKKDNIPIGSITAVQDFPESGYCELGYCLSKDLWGEGITTEALKAVVRYIFNTTDYVRIQARYDIENEASGRCMEKANFKLMCEFDDMFPKRKEMRTFRIMCIERKDIMPI